MLKDAKWLIFGGIGYRFRGFLIGVAVGFGLASFAPSVTGYLKEYISWFVPSAHAAPYYDWDFVGDDFSNISDSLYAVPDSSDRRNLGQKVEALTTGTLTHVQVRLGLDDGTRSTDLFRFVVMSDDSNVPDAVLGYSAYYDIDTLSDRVTAAANDCENGPNPYCPITTYPLYPDSVGSLDFTSSDTYWLFLEYLNPYSAGAGARVYWYLHQDTFPYASYRRSYCTGLSPVAGCSHSAAANRLSYTAIFDDGSPYDILGLFGVGYGPHISLDPLTYDLPYYCNHAGDIWGYDSSVGGSYSDLGVSCLSGDAGFLTLDLSGSLSEWSFQLMFDNVPIADAAATIYYNPNNEPILPPDGTETVDLDFCFPFLISDEEEQEPELDVDEEISSGFLVWAKGVAVAAFSTIYGGLVQVPVIGDYMLINCMMYTDFIGSLDPDADLAFTMNFDGFMEFDDTDEISVDLSSAVDEVETTASANPRYELFRQSMTALFIFVVFWKVWMLLHPGSKKEDDSMSPY